MQTPERRGRLQPLSRNSKDAASEQDSTAGAPNAADDSAANEAAAQNEEADLGPIGQLSKTESNENFKSPSPRVPAKEHKSRLDSDNSAFQDQKSSLAQFLPDPIVSDNFQVSDAIQASEPICAETEFPEEQSSWKFLKWLRNVFKSKDKREHCSSNSDQPNSNNSLNRNPRLEAESCKAAKNVVPKQIPGQAEAAEQVRPPTSLVRPAQQSGTNANVELVRRRRMEEDKQINSLLQKGRNLFSRIEEERRIDSILKKLVGMDTFNNIRNWSLEQRRRLAERLDPSLREWKQEMAQEASSSSDEEEKRTLDGSPWPFARPVTARSLSKSAVYAASSSKVRKEPSLAETLQKLEAKWPCPPPPYQNPNYMQHPQDQLTNQLYQPVELRPWQQ